MTTELTYDPALAATEAHHAVRLLVHDTHADRPLLDDREIAYFLALRGLTATDHPVTKSGAVLLAAASAARAIEAKLASESEITITEVGAVKSNAAAEYRQLRKALERQAAAGATPSFADPAAYATTHVTGIDPVPELEA